MPHHILVFTLDEQARLKMGESFPVNDYTAIQFEQPKRRAHVEVVNGEATALVPVKRKRYQLSPEQLEKKRAYSRDYYHKKRRASGAASNPQGFTYEQLVRQPHPNKNGNYPCRVCRQEYASWQQLRSHLGGHLSTMGLMPEKGA